MLNQLQAVSRTYQDRQRRPSIKTLRSPCFRKPNSGGIKCLPQTPQERRNENIDLNKGFFFSSGDRTHNQLLLQSHTCAPAARMGYFKLAWMVFLSFIPHIGG